MVKSGIEWTEATWNPIVGCSIVSPGCTNCYAMTMAARLEAMGTLPHYGGTTQKTKAGPVWTGKLALAPEASLLAPLRRRKPTTYFVNSMGDLFHEDVPDDSIDRVFAVMALTPQHTYQVLTKRSGRMRAYMDQASGRIADVTIALRKHPLAIARGVGPSAVVPVPHLRPGAQWWPLANVWLGVSAEDQRRADERIPDLLATPAAIRFVSAEPLLGPIDFERIPMPQDEGRECSALDGHEIAGMVGNCVGYIPPLDWIIVGGESGPNTRPMHPDWARSIRDQCAAAGTAFFFKQWGEHLPLGQTLPDFGKIHGATAVKPGRMRLHYGGTREKRPDHAFAERGVEFSSVDNCLTFRVGKARAGRRLDGVTHDAMPEAHHA
jgi:protein gp37